MIEKPHPASFAFELLSSSSLEVFAHFSKIVGKRTNLAFFSFRKARAFLGHKKSDNTLSYVQLDQRLFNETQDEFVVKTARTPEEAAKLIEVSFQLEDTIDGIHLYRKRK